MGEFSRYTYNVFLRSFPACLWDVWDLHHTQGSEEQESWMEIHHQQQWECDSPPGEALLLLFLFSIILWHVTMVQMVRVGLCISTGACHGLGHVSLTPSHVTHVSQCRQLYLDQRLVAVTQTGEVKVDENMKRRFSKYFSITLGWDVQFSFMLLLSYNEFDPLTFSQH